MKWHNFVVGEGYLFSWMKRGCTLIFRIVSGRGYITFSHGLGKHSSILHLLIMYAPLYQG